MEYQIYLDVIFFVNFIMDYLILCLMSIVFHYEAKFTRRLLGSFIGAIMVCIMVLIPIPIGLIGYLIYVLVVSFSMVYVAFGSKTFMGLVKQVICLYILTFLFGGIINWLMFETQVGFYIQNMLQNPDLYQLGIKNFCIGAASTFILLTVFSKSVSKIHKGKDPYFFITLFFEEEEVTTIGLLDTGNALVDPMTKKPVIVGEFEVIKKGLKEPYQSFIQDFITNKQIDYERVAKENLTRIRWIPFQSIGEEAGMMVGVLCKRCVIKRDKEIMFHENVVVAMSANTLSLKHEYFVILHPELVNQ